MKTISTRCVRFVSGLREVCASFCVRSSSIYRPTGGGKNPAHLRARRSLPPEGLPPTQRASRHLKGFQYALLVFLFLANFYTPADAQQKMYWVTFADGQIKRADLDGGNIETLVQQISPPWAIALDIASGKMYWSSSNIHRADLNGGNMETIVDGTGGRGIALDLINGNMYWTSGAIYRADLDGSNVETLVSPAGFRRGIALDLTNNKMYWTDADTDDIQRANLDGSNIEILVTGLNTPSDIDLDIPNGKMYWTNTDQDKIQYADLDGQNVADLVATRHPLGIALDLTNGKMYWTNTAIEEIHRADLDGSNVELLASGSGVDSGYGIALDLSTPPPPPAVAIHITADPNPAIVGNPLDILLDVDNPGEAFNAKFRLWVLANGNVTTLVSISPFVDAGFTLTDFPVFSTASVPTGLPPTVEFFAAIFDDGSDELLDWDFQILGIGVPPPAADISALRQAATNYLKHYAVNAAPKRQEPRIDFNGTANNPFPSDGNLTHGHRVSTKGKLATTWGNIKSQR